ncbi:MAG: galactitol-1-phosphate 5-dehydrogenase [Acidimicrobiales bacterium]|jgi:L-iditol 2-dehydrogenase
MNALVLTAPSRLEYGEIPVADVCEDEVLVEVRACGICGSDVHGIDGSTRRRIPPLVMGHEASGVIAKLGAGVSGWAVGDRVTFDSTVSCGKCQFCAQGQVNLCDERQVLGVSCDEYRRDGAMAEFVAIPARILFSIPEELSFARAALLETLSIAVHAVRRAAASPGDTAVVVGTGMVGLLVVQALQAKGCEHVIGVDINPERLALAEHFGAETICGGAEVAAPMIRERTRGRGADLAIEVVGLSDPIETAIASVRKGGRVCLVGNVSPRVEMNLQSTVTREITLYGSCASAGEYPECIELLSSGKVDVDPVITAVAPLSEGAAWFDRLGTAGDLMKVVLEPTKGVS